VPASASDRPTAQRYPKKLLALRLSRVRHKENAPRVRGPTWLSGCGLACEPISALRGGAEGFGFAPPTPPHPPPVGDTDPPPTTTTRQGHYGDLLTTGTAGSGCCRFAPPPKPTHPTLHTSPAHAVAPVKQPRASANHTASTQCITSSSCG
jgi:hypothetical protein